MSRLTVGSIEGLASEGYRITVPTGSKIVQAGGVLQVIQTIKSDTFTTTSTTFTGVTGLSATITPSAANSLILVIASVTGCNDPGVAAGFIRMVRGSTPILVGDSPGSRSQGQRIESVTASATATFGLSVLDNPATTSPVTYSVQARTINAGTFCVNRSRADTDDANNPRAASSIILMEVAG